MENPNFFINANTGQITTSVFTPNSMYKLKIFQKFNGTRNLSSDPSNQFIYTVTNFIIELSNPYVVDTIYSKINTLINTKKKINLCKISKNLLTKKYIILNRPSHGKAIIKKNILIYYPNYNFTGKDKLSVGVVNINGVINEEIDIKICVKKYC